MAQVNSDQVVGTCWDFIQDLYKNKRRQTINNKNIRHSMPTSNDLDPARAVGMLIAYNIDGAHCKLHHGDMLGGYLN